MNNLTNDQILELLDECIDNDILDLQNMCLDKQTDTQEYKNLNERITEELKILRSLIKHTIKKYE